MAENEDPPDTEGVGDAAKPQDRSSNRAGIVSWIRKISGDVRDDLVKDTLKEGVKAAVYIVVGVFLGGGIFLATQENQVRDAFHQNKPTGHAYLLDQITSVRDEGYKVEWTQPGDPFIVYCEGFEAPRSTVAERLQEFARQFDGCITATEPQSIGSELVIQLALGPTLSPPICLQQEGAPFEQVYFCNCGANEIVDVIGKRTLLNDATIASCPLMSDE
mgnify:CR=1 FL=1